METVELIQLGAVVVGATEVVKKLLEAIPFLSMKVCDALVPLVAVLIGGGVNIYLVGYSPENLIVGLILGLSASGLYKVAKSW